MALLSLIWWFLLSLERYVFSGSLHCRRFFGGARERCLSMFLPSSSLRRFLGVRTIWREQIGGEWWILTWSKTFAEGGLYVFSSSFSLYIHEIRLKKSMTPRTLKCKPLYIWTKGFFFSNNLTTCERFEPRSHFKSRLGLIVRVNVGLNSTIVVDSDWRFDNLRGNHLQSQSELYHVSWWYCTRVIDLIGQLGRDVIGRLSVRPWCYWLWRLVK